jgi:ribosomal protein L29
VSKRSERVREIRALDMASAQKELDEKRKDLFMLRLRKERRREEQPRVPAVEERDRKALTA